MSSSPQSSGPGSWIMGSSNMKENLDGVVPLADPPTDVDAYVEILKRVLAGENVVDDAKKTQLLEYCSNESFARRVGEALAESLE